MKIVCMGTNAFVVPIFDAARRAGHEIIAVFTRVPKPAGRKKILTPTPVEDWARANNIPVRYSPRDYDLSPDMVVVASYGVILRDNVLNSAPCVNIHPSDLPKYRGASPIRTAIYNGDKTSAVCLMNMVAECDAGDVLMRVPFDIGDDDTNDTIEARVSEIGARMLVQYLATPGDFVATPQVGTPTFTRKFDGDDEVIDWRRGPREIHNQVRSLGTGRTKINGVDVKILKTRIGADGNLEIVTLQPAGKKPMDWKSFVNGLRGAEIKIGQ